MEYIDIFDENNNPKKQVKEKGKAHEEGDFHRTAHVWIINDKNELLLQNDKDLYDEIIAKINTALKNIDLEYAKKIELHEHSNKAILDSLTNEKVSEWDAKSNFSGNYNDLTNQPQINGELLQGNKTLEDIGLSEFTDEEIDKIIMNLGGL